MAILMLCMYLMNLLLYINYVINHINQLFYRCIQRLMNIRNLGSIFLRKQIMECLNYEYFNILEGLLNYLRHFRAREELLLYRLKMLIIYLKTNKIQSKFGLHWDFILLYRKIIGLLISSNSSYKALQKQQQFEKS
mgnify:FL=1